jgi:diguanylate cyclase (GGDEF)-like protein
LPRTRGDLREESEASLVEALARKLRLGRGERPAAAPAPVGREFDQLSDGSLEELEVARSSAKTPAEKRAVEALARKAYSDTLTPAGNRTAYEDFLSRPRDGWHVVLDLNDFKNVNDAFGHAVGDEAVGRAGAAFSEASRANQGKLFRQGGDEFHAFFATRKQAQAFAEQAKAKFDAMLPIRDDHRLSFSAGIGRSPSEADVAAAQAKRDKVARYGGARVAADARGGHGESFVRAAGPAPEARDVGGHPAQTPARPDIGPKPDAVAPAPGSLAHVADLPAWGKGIWTWMWYPPARGMVWIAAVVLLALWSLGIVNSSSIGGSIPILLAMALITLLAGRSGLGRIVGATPEGRSRGHAARHGRDGCSGSSTEVM